MPQWCHVPHKEFSYGLRSNTTRLARRRGLRSLRLQILDGAFGVSGQDASRSCFRLRTRQRMELYTITIGPQATAHYLQARTINGPGSGGIPKMLFHLERSVNAFLTMMYTLQGVQFYQDCAIGVYQDVKSQAVCAMPLIATPYPQD